MNNPTQKIGLSKQIEFPDFHYTNLNYATFQKAFEDALASMRKKMEDKKPKFVILTIKQKRTLNNSVNTTCLL